MANTAITEFLGLIRELERVAMSSPIVSIFLCLALGDFLHRYGRNVSQGTDFNGKPVFTTIQEGLLSDATWNGLQFIIYSNAGIKLGTDLLGALSQFTDLVGNRTQTDIFTPSVSTLVLNPQPTDTTQLNALLSQLAQKKG